MHEIAERGVAAHFLYKESTDAVRNPLISIDKQMEDWVSWMRDVFDKAGSTNASQEVIESFKMNLFQDEIYVFTPKGELRILPCLLYTSDAADERSSVDLGGRRIIKKKKKQNEDVDGFLKIE